MLNFCLAFLWRIKLNLVQCFYTYYVQQNERKELLIKIKVETGLFSSDVQIRFFLSFRWRSTSFWKCHIKAVPNPLRATLSLKQFLYVFRSRSSTCLSRSKVKSICSMRRSMWNNYNQNTFHWSKGRLWTKWCWFSNQKSELFFNNTNF